MGNDGEVSHGVNRHRFAAGWRHLLPHEEPGPVPDIVVDVIRPDDLVSLTVAGYYVELVTGDSPVLRALAPDARLVVGFAYQHLGEEAIYEDEDAEEVTPPIDALPARGSRLVYALAEEEIVAVLGQGDTRRHGASAAGGPPSGHSEGRTHPGTPIRADHPSSRRRGRGARRDRGGAHRDDVTDQGAGSVARRRPGYSSPGYAPGAGPPHLCRRHRGPPR